MYIISLYYYRRIFYYSMKLNKYFLFLFMILIVLCAALYFIGNPQYREGLSTDTNNDAVAEAQGYVNNKQYAGASGYIKILPMSNSVLNSTPARGIMSSYPDITDMPISQYLVKSSYNSACSGTGRSISNEMLKYVLSRGCRFIDFEISNINDVPYVVFSDPTAIVPIDKNKISKLDDILKTAMTYGLGDADGHAPNYKDPLFINLRINPDSTIYQKVASSIYANVGNQLYGFEGTGVEPVDVNVTKMSDIMGKAVIIMDPNYNTKWRSQSECSGSTMVKCYDLSNFVHLESGNNIIKTTSPSLLSAQIQTPIIPISDSLGVSNTGVQIILPEDDRGLLNTVKTAAGSNPDLKTIVLGWSCNFITNRFYIQDDAFRKYESLFNSQRLGIVPLSYVRNYYLKK